jgi:rod shape-determining protein MreC
MKMEFSYRSPRGTHSRKKSRLVATTILVVVLFLIDVISGGKLRASVRVFGSMISTWSGQAGATFTGSGFFTSRAALESQNRTLSEQVAQLQGRAAALSAVQEENDQLRAIVHLAAKSPGVTAPVVSSLEASPYGTFLIGAGSQDGIAVGNLVLSEDGFVIGRVNDTSARQSLVSELFAPNATVSATVNAVPISLSGQGGGNARANVLRSAAIAIGDIAIAPGLGERPVGIVGQVASSSASASQDVYVRTPLNLSSLQFVYVVPG